METVKFLKSLEQIYQELDQKTNEVADHTDSNYLRMLVKEKATIQKVLTYARTKQWN